MDTRGPFYFDQPVPVIRDAAGNLYLGAPPLGRVGGGAFPLGRGVGTAIAFSGHRVITPTGDTTEQPLFKFVSTEDGGRPWNVSLCVKPRGDGVRDENENMFAVVKWTAGGLMSSAEVDMIAGTAAFQLCADSIDLYVVNSTPAVPGNNPVDVFGAITPAGQVGISRAPRRTVIKLLPSPFAAVDVIIPRWSQRLQVIMPTGALGMEFFNGQGGLIATGQFANPENMTLEIPNGAVFLRTTNNPFSKATQVAFVFLLGL